VNSSRAAALCLLLALAAAIAAGQTPQFNAADFAGKNYNSYLKAFFGRPDELPGVAASHSVVVTVRVTGDRQLETQVSMLKVARGEFKAVTIQADGEPVTQQLADLRQRHARASTPEIFKNVRIRRTTASGPVGRVLDSLLKRLEELRVSPIPDDSLFFPAVRYQVWVATPSSEVTFLLTAPPPSLVGRDGEGATPPLVGWAREVLSAVGLESDQDLRRRAATGSQ
jgi:hypothetical protein